MKIHNISQGTDEWKKLRLERFTASEAPAMLGVSKHVKRDHLLHEKFTGKQAPVSDFTQRLFDKGHQTEADARPIAEEIVGEELYPATVTEEIDGLPLLASVDGMSMAGHILFEHKLWNESLASDINNDTLAPHYTMQIAQQLLVTGADKCLFMCSDGTDDKMEWRWVHADDSTTKTLIDGWKQFEKDLEDYEPPVTIQADSQLENLYSSLEALREQRQALDDEIKAIESDIKGLAESYGASEVIGHGFKVALVERKGSVDYKKIPELKGVDLDQYRKPPSAYYQIKKVTHSA